MEDHAELQVAAMPDCPDAPVGSFHPGYNIVSSPPDLRRLTTYLRAPSQPMLPVIVIGTLADTDRTPALAPETLCPIVDPRTAIYWLVNRSVRQRLTHKLGRPLSLTSDIRVYWPIVTSESDPAGHPSIAASADENDTLAALVQAIDLSRPTMRAFRAQLDATARRLTTAQQGTHRLTSELEAAREETRATQAMLDAATQRLTTLSELEPEMLKKLSGMDTEELLHFLIFGEWLFLTAADRREHPLGRYLFGPQFVDSVNSQRLDVPLARIGFACAMVSSRRAKGHAGLEPHAYRAVGVSGGASPQTIRADGARAMTCALGQSRGAPRLKYWLLPDGTIEFATVGKHDDGRRS